MLPRDVCFLAGTLGQGGAERQLFNTLKALKECGVGLSVLCLSKGEFWEKEIRELNIPVTWVGQQESKLMRLACIIRTLRRRRPVVLQSQHLYTNLYAVAAARALGLREVGALRNDWVPQLWGQTKVTSRLNLRMPRAVAVNSKAAIRNIAAMGMPVHHLHFLPNVVDTDQFAPTTRPETAVVRLLAVGQLGKQKRFDRFLSILASLRQESTRPIKGVIVGAGSWRARLEQQAVELGLLPDAVEFAGSVQNLAPAYRSADILVSTSDYEGTPNVILEAMATGLPVVATRVGDVPDIVRHGETGYLAEPHYNRSITDGLLALINDEQMRTEFGIRARKYIEANHSLNRLPGVLEEFYSEALS